MVTPTPVEQVEDVEDAVATKLDEDEDVAK